MESNRDSAYLSVPERTGELMSNVLEFPFFDLVDVNSNTIRLTMNGKNEKNFSGTTLEQAAEEATKEIARHSARLERPVKARLTVNRDKIIRNTIVYPDGHAEVISSQAIVEKKPFYKKPFIIAGATALIFLGAGGSGYAYYAYTQSQVSAPLQETKVSNIEIKDVQTLTKPLASSDSKYVAFTKNNALNIASSETGEIVSTLDLGESPDTVTLRILSNGGYVATWGKRMATWTEQDGFSSVSSFPSGQKMLVTRSGETVIVSRENSSQPDSVETVKGKVFSRPSEGASFLYVKEDLAYWATATNGGSIVTAAETGEQQDIKTLASPEPGAELISWSGISSQGNVVSVWKVGESLILATQSPNSDSVEKTVNVTSAEKSTFTQTGNLLLLDNEVINLDTLNIFRAEGDIQEVSSKAAGFTASLDGNPVFIDENGVHKASVGEIIGFTENNHQLVLDEQTLIVDLEGTTNE